MIDIVLKKAIKKPYKITKIVDINNDELWVDYLTKIIGNVDVIYSGNNWVRDLFKKKHYQVRPVKYAINISGTKLREMMKNKNEKWKQYVSPNIIDLIKNER